MSEINISLLRRIVDPLLASNLELQQQLMPIVEAANSDGVANEEDNVLTDEEARVFLERNRAEAAAGRSILTRNRSALAGSLADARSVLRARGASPELLSLLEMAASQEPDMDASDGEDANEMLSSDEIELLVQTYQQQYETLGGERLPGDAVATFMNDVRSAVRDMRALREEVPEAFLPETEAGRRETIDLDFLKELPLTAFFEDTPQAQMLQSLVAAGGVDLEDRDAHWDLSYEDLSGFVENLPDEARGELPPLENLMANLRFTARVMREELSDSIAAAIASGNAADGAGLDLRPLLARRDEFGDNPYIDLLANIAGPDGILTSPEIVAHIREIEAENPGVVIDPQVFLASATQLVADMTGATAEEASEISAGMAASRDDILNQRVLDDLSRMREGFTAMDMDYVENDSVFAFANAGMHFFTFAATLGIYHLCDGPSYRDAMRESVEMHDSERGRALQALRNLVERPNREFRNWLATRDEDERGVNIPNALEFLRSAEERFNAFLQTILTTRLPEEELNGYIAAWDSGDPAQRETIPAALREYIWFRAGYGDEEITMGRVVEHLHLRGIDAPRDEMRFHELLVGDLFQADRLWEIHNTADRETAEDAWYQFADDLRSGYWVGGEGGTHLDGINNPAFARAILHGLRRQSPTSEMRSEARIAYQDSTGQDITLDSGEVMPGLFGWTYFNEGGGELGLWPPDWFRNFSDENVGAAINDALLVIATWRAGGILFRGFTRFMAGGLGAAGRGVVTFLGWNLARTAAAGAVETMAAEGVSTVARDFFTRRLAAWASNNASRAADRLIALEATGASRAELAAAREAFSRAERVHQILSAPSQISTRSMAAAAMEHAPWMESLATNVTARMTALAEQWSERWLLFQNSGIGNAVGVGIWMTGHGLRGAGRLLRYMSYEGIVTLGIAGYIYEHVPRHTNQPLVHDREYDLFLPEETDAPTDTDSEDDSTLPVADPVPDDDEETRGRPSAADEEELRLARGIVEAGE